MRCKGDGYADEKEKTNVASQAAARVPLPELPKKLLEWLIKGPMSSAEVQDLMQEFDEAVIERAMGAEMNMHLGYPPSSFETLCARHKLATKVPLLCLANARKK